VQRYRDAREGSSNGTHVVAPTGVSAAVCKGVTIHAYLRLRAGCFDETISEMADAKRLYRTMDVGTRNRLAHTSVLLVDEVSMVSSRMFTTLCYAINEAHKQLNENGSWRAVVFGDFLQLPPVVKCDEDTYDVRGLYSFRSPYWTELFGREQLELRYVWRQEDLDFIQMLSRLRVGIVSDDMIAFLKQRHDAYAAEVEGGGVVDLDTTHIFPLRKSVLRHNNDCLLTMEVIQRTKRMRYEANDYPIGVNLSPAEVRKQLNAALRAPAFLDVCVGARVAACATLKNGLVPNGTIGVVRRFSQVPGGGFNGASKVVPIVEFNTPGGAETVEVVPVDMELRAVAHDGPYACRNQIPLVLAWAVTVHRCQGLTMDAAVLDLAPCVICGMVYVALSRVRTMGGVHIMSFNRAKVSADARVAHFHSMQESVAWEFSSCVDSNCRA